MDRRKASRASAPQLRERVADPEYQDFDRDRIDAGFDEVMRGWCVLISQRKSTRTASSSGTRTNSSPATRAAFDG